MPSGRGTTAWLRFLVVNGMIGLMAGLPLATALIAENISGLAHVMHASIGIPAGWGLLALAFGSSYGFLAIATAVMLLSNAEAPERIPSRPT